MSVDVTRGTAIVDAVEKTTALPAIPSRDWCDRGAAVLSDLMAPKSGKSVFAVAVGRGVDRLESVDAVGFHGTDPVATTELQQSLSRGLPLAPRREHEIAYATGADLHRSDMWLRSPLMKCVSSQGMSGLLLGVGSISDTAPGRLLWFFGAHETSSHSETTNDATLLVTTLIAMLRRSRLALGTEPGRAIDWVSEREHETLGHVVRGLSVREIAEKTGRSSHTVHDHVKSLHRKLGASSRGELVARALGHAPSIRHHVAK